MKNLTFLSFLAIVVMLCSTAFADMAGGPIVNRKANALFNAKPATAATVLNSNVTRAFNNQRATAVFAIMSSNNGLTTNTAIVMPTGGSAALQCAPTVSGPWVTIKDKLGTAVSLAAAATPTTFELDSLCNFLRGTWVPGAVSTNRTFYLYLLGAD